MSDAKPFAASQVNLPFPYPMRNSSDQKPVWPFNEEGFLMIFGSVDESAKVVTISDVPGILALLKMGFFGLNSNKEINHFVLIENLKVEEKQSQRSTYSLGYYSLCDSQIAPALQALPNDINASDKDLNVSKLPEKTKPLVDSLKLTLEEAYFIAHVFGMLLISRSGEYYTLKDLWQYFCKLVNEDDDAEFATRYAAYYYFRSKGWVVRNGFKFGAHFLLYKEGPPFNHAHFSVVVRHSQNPRCPLTFAWSDISALTRVANNSRKQLILCTVELAGKQHSIHEGPECIQQFAIHLAHINRWNSLKGEFVSSKL